MSEHRPLPTLSVLDRLLSFDPSTGKFYWKAHRQGIQPGDEAGCIDNGYRVIRVDRVGYRAGRLAWLMFYKEDPGKWQVDHINLDRDDNRIKNLRLVTCSMNNRNRGIPSNNKSGVVGVHWVPHRRLWHARITDRGRKLHLGYFRTLQAAAAAAGRLPRRATSAAVED